MTDPTVIDLLSDVDAYLCALHVHGDRHDQIGADLTCGGCVLRDRIAAALPQLAAVPPADQTTDRAAVLREAADIAESLRQFEPATGARKSAQVSENVGILRVAEELRRLAAEAQPFESARDSNTHPKADPKAGSTIHACPRLEDNGKTPCCHRPPFEMRGDRLTRDPEQVTCTGPAAGARQDGAQP